MAGTWLSQNKIRPGAYIVFRAIRQMNLATGDRGIVTIPLSLPWGPLNKLITVTSSEFVRGQTYNKIGLLATDPLIQPIRETFKGATTALLWRMGTGGAKAKVEPVTDLNVEAAYVGVLGNSIAVASILVPETRVVYLKDANGEFILDALDQKIPSLLFDVVTTVNNVEVDRQSIRNTSEFIERGWITFVEQNAILEAFAGVSLTGGVDPTVGTANYTAYMDALATEIWQVMAVPTIDPTIPPLITTFINDLRENAGKKVQAVVYDYEPNYEGIISVDQGYWLGAEEVPVTSAICFVAGISAGANLNESNTYRMVPGATAIINPKTAQEIESALRNGKFVFSMRQDKVIVVEKDINSLYEFSQDRSYVFSKNRVIRTLDDIATQIALLFERSYIGKVDNNDSGRTLLKGDIIGYLGKLEQLGAIQNLSPEEDLEVLPGNDVDSVVVNLWVQTVDSMEKLYMTVFVS